MHNSPVRRWFTAALRLYPWRSASLVVLSIVNSLSDGLSISLLIPFVTLLVGDAEIAMTAGGLLGKTLRKISAYAGEGHELLAVSGLIVALVILRCAAGYAEGLIASWISGRISCDVRSRMHENLLRVDFNYICVNDNGRLLNTLDDQAWRATEGITACFGLLTSACMTAVFLSILFFISWKLTLLVIALVGLVSLVMLLFDRPMRGIGAQSVSAAEKLSERAIELLDAMRMVRAFGRERDAQSAYEGASKRLFDISMRNDRVGGLAGAVQEIFYAVNFVIVIFFALWLGMSGAALIGYLALLHRLQPHVRAFDSARMHLASLSASILAVSNLLRLQPWSTQTMETARPVLKNAIRFDHVTFAYSGKDAESRNALEDVTLAFPIGKVTAVIGWSGAGKSTLTNLLLRFHDPDKGAVTVDGIPLLDMDLAWWRSQLAIAGQDADLIGGTIRDNIAYGKEGASFEEIVDAAKRASVHEFILTLPRAYDTRIGERGVLLSGGQRQRIGLARALVRKSSILILDEATNAVDSMTEWDILRALEALRGQMTIIVIAHRLSTTRTADQVIALAEGRVVEAGAPCDLMRRNGLYTRMVQLQEWIDPLTKPTTLADAPARVPSY